MLRDDAQNIKIIYENMINLQESITFEIESDDHSPKNLLDVCWILNKKFREYIINNSKYTNNTYRYKFGDERVTPDGDDYDKTSGIINVYIHDLPSKIISKILSMIIYHIGEYGQVLQEPYLDKSKLHGGGVYRIKTRIDVDIPSPPSLNLSNDNANIILKLLGLIEKPHRILATELLTKIEKIINNKSLIQNFTRDNESIGNFTSLELTESRIIDILLKLKNISENAIKNNDAYISIG